MAMNMINSKLLWKRQSRNPFQAGKACVLRTKNIWKDTLVVIRCRTSLSQNFTNRHHFLTWTMEEIMESWITEIMEQLLQFQFRRQRTTIWQKRRIILYPSLRKLKSKFFQVKIQSFFVFLAYRLVLGLASAVCFVLMIIYIVLKVHCFNKKPTSKKVSKETIITTPKSLETPATGFTNTAFTSSANDLRTTDDDDSCRRVLPSVYVISY